MKFWELFSVPEGKKITEKYLFRVLASSICIILLYMGCLAGTTWAWFAVSIENTENELVIGPPVVVSVGDSEFLSGSTLSPGEYTVRVHHANNKADVFGQTSTRYVTFSVDETVMGYVTLNVNNSYTTHIQIHADQECVLSWIDSWFMPDNAEPLSGDVITVSIEEETEPTDATTESTESVTEPTQSETEPTEEVTQPDETETEPTEGVTQPGETETEPTEEVTQPGETETEPAEEVTQPGGTETEPTGEAAQPGEKEPTGETTQPAESETNSTENET